MGMTTPSIPDRRRRNRKCGQKGQTTLNPQAIPARRVRMGYMLRGRPDARGGRRGGRALSLPNRHPRRVARGEAIRDPQDTPIQGIWVGADAASAWFPGRGKRRETYGYP